VVVKRWSLSSRFGRCRQHFVVVTMQFASLHPASVGLVIKLWSTLLSGFGQRCRWQVAVGCLLPCGVHYSVFGKGCAFHYLVSVAYQALFVGVS
jgi:hypothetical protein